MQIQCATFSHVQAFLRSECQPELPNCYFYNIDRWMSWDSKTLSTVFQLYLPDLGKIRAKEGTRFEPFTVRLRGQRINPLNNIHNGNIVHLVFLLTLYIKVFIFHPPELLWAPTFISLCSLITRHPAQMQIFMTYLNYMYHILILVFFSLSYVFENIVNPCIHMCELLHQCMQYTILCLPLKHLVIHHYCLGMLIQKCQTLDIGKCRQAKSRDSMNDLLL